MILSIWPIQSTGRVTILSGFLVTEVLWGVGKYQASYHRIYVIECCSSTDTGPTSVSPDLIPATFAASLFAWNWPWSFTAALLAKRPIFWHCNWLAEATHTQTRDTQLPGTNVHATQKLSMACTAFLCSALLFSWSKMLQGWNFVTSYICIFIFIVYCHYVTILVPF